MRIAVILLILGILQASAEDAYSQKTRLSLNFSETELGKVLDTIETESEFFFLYNEKLLDTDRKVSITAKDQVISMILDNLFTGTDVKYTIIDRKIILAPDYLTEPAVQQQRSINGKVTDEDGNPLPGVNVMVRGTTIGVVTDINGKFTIIVPSDGKQFVISFIGMITQEVDIQDNLTIVMKSDQIGLEEVIVIGYGTSKKRDLLGSVAKVTGPKVVSLSTQTLDAVLQGNASGVQVSASSGHLGTFSRVLIRGAHSISSKSEPLWVIDGVIIGSSTDYGGPNGGPNAALTTINPNDIESMEVLKDAAATSIYGQRGSNGVIIITTKSGKEGVTATNIDYSQGISTLTRSSDDFGLANTKQWFDIVETARANSQLVPVQFDPVVHGGVAIIDPTATLTRDQALATQVPWFDQILRTGSFKEINLSTSGGSKKESHFLSFNYRNDESVVINNFLRRLTFRANSSYFLTENLKVEARIFGSYSFLKQSHRNEESIFSSALDISPWNPIYKPEDPTKLWNTQSGRNLIASFDPVNSRADNMTYRILAASAVTYNVPFIKGLSLRGEATIDYLPSTQIYWINTVLRPLSALGSDFRDMHRVLSYNIYASYDKTFGDHNINLVMGTESQMQKKENSLINGEDLVGTSQQVGTPITLLTYYHTFGGEKYMRGYFGRGNYKFKDKYLVGISFRRDGTSEFISDYRWGTFIALSAGWIISDENFMKNIKQINFLKVKGSFGQTGNANIPGGLNSPGYLNWFRYGARANNVGTGTAFSSFPVTNISWETTNATDVGIDFGILENRISGSIGYYNQKVVDMLLAVPIPISGGMFTFGTEGSIWANIGDMKNYGIEFEINTINLDMNNFRWTSSLNISTNKNKILRLNTVLDEVGNGLLAGTASDLGNTLSRTGGHLGTWYMNEYAGLDPDHGYPLIYKTDNNIYLLDASGKPTTERNPNYLHRYVDPETGGNVIIPATNSNTNLNRILLEDKTYLPTWFGGLSNSFSYKRFELSFLFSFAGGNYLYDNLARKIHSPTSGNFVSNLKDLSWTPTNSSALLPPLSATGKYDEYDKDGNLVTANQNFNAKYPTTQFLVKGDFVRLRTMRFNYDFQESIAERIKLKGLSVYVAANNLLTWTAEFKGLDPEGVNQNDRFSNLDQGNRGAGLPTLKVYYFGVNVKF